MGRYSVSGETAGAGTSARPVVGVMGVASVAPKVRQIKLVNTTTTLVVFAIRRLTAAGTPGSALTETEYDPGAAPPNCTGFDTWSADATLEAGVIDTISLPGVIGYGEVLTFGGDTGLTCPVGTANGIGVIPVTTGQIVKYTMVWDE